jgi:peptidoglycan/xylan/chitin deacetylase (PgdA/CDA1 family)
MRLRQARLLRAMDVQVGERAVYRRNSSTIGFAAVFAKRPGKPLETSARYAGSIMTIKNALISAGFAGFRVSGLHRLARKATRGRGVILTFHRVRAQPPLSYAPNRQLEITPEFLDLALSVVRREGFELVSLDEARRRIGDPKSAAFAALTFDDGYRDTRDVALPVLERHGAPFTVYCATGFIDGGARLWWLELEEAIRRLDAVDAAIAGGRLRLDTRSPDAKTAAFERIYWILRGRPEPELLDVVEGLARSAGVERERLADRLFMSWSDLEALSRHPLATIGAHGITHRRLAQWSAAEAHSEMAGSKSGLESRLGIAVRHFAYPVGDSTSAGPREFQLAREIGFETAVTTRPGMLFSEYAGRLTELPRASVNGRWQEAEALEVLLSGAPFWLWNRGRRVAAA